MVKPHQEETGGKDNHFGSTVNTEEVGYETQEVVQFADSVHTLVDSQYVSTSIPETYYVETVKEWLTRPLQIHAGQWKDTDSTGDLLFSADFPSVLIKEAILSRKLENFKYMRADVRISVRMNGLKTQYGKLLLNWGPYSDPSDEHYARTSNIYAATGYPHVIVSPTESEVVELVVPFASPFNWYEIAASDIQFGSIFLYVLNPLQNIASTTPVNYLVFANFENIELNGYTALPRSPPFLEREFVPVKAQRPIQCVRTQDPVVPQAKRGPRKKAGFIMDKTQKSQVSETTVQAAEAKDKASTGVVSGFLNKVGSAASLMTQVPVIGSVAGIVSTAASIGSKIASIFGFSKPDTVADVQPRTIRYVDTAHAAGLDTSVKLALSQENYVKSGLSWMGNLDVMDFDHICSKPMLVNIVSWDETDTGVFGAVPVGPLLVHEDVVSTRKVFFPTYLSWVADAFNYWRGDLCYYIFVTCSSFHSGRFRITFVPTTEAINATQTQYAINRVVDVQTETEVKICIPYLFKTPYCRTGDYEEQGTIGNLYFTVVNPLISTSDGSSSVYVNTMVSGHNMQFGAPRNVDFYGSRTPFIETIDDPLLPQALTSESEQIATYNPLMRSVSSFADGVSMGENPVSVKDLIMRPGPYISAFRAPTPKTNVVASGYADLTRNALGALLNVNFPAPGRYVCFVTFAYLEPDDGGSEAFLNISTGVATTYKLYVDRFPLNFSTSTFNVQHLQTRFSIYITQSGTLGFDLDAVNRDGGGKALGFDCGVNLTTTFVSTEYDIAIPPIEIPPIEPPDFEPSERRDIGIILNTPLYTPYSPDIGSNFTLYASGRSYIAYFSQIYRFWRGSTRFKYIQFRGTSMKTFSMTRKTYGTPTTVPVVVETNASLAEGIDACAGSIFVREPVSNTLEATWPFYYPLYSIICSDKNRIQTPQQVSTVEQLAIVAVQDNYQLNDEYQASVLQSAGDDFEFGFLVPPGFVYATPESPKRFSARKRTAERF